MDNLYKMTLCKKAMARVLLIAFAFSAWSLTGLAHVALFLLLALFLWEIPKAWDRLRRDPAFFLAICTIVLIVILASRAAALYPQIAMEQWHAIWVWSAPFMFIVVSWWIQNDFRQIWVVLIAAMLGIVFGVLRKFDWSLTGQIFNGLRYDFGYTALGIAFIASVTLIGLYLFRTNITRIQIYGKNHPILGWGLWIVLTLFFLGILVATQARGSALSLLIVMAGFSIYRTFVSLRKDKISLKKLLVAVFSGMMFFATATTVLWTRWPIIVEELKLLSQSTAVEELSYQQSLTIRMNLYRIGFRLFFASPILGWGPGTSSTEYLVPEQVIAFSDYDLQNAPAMSHLHSVFLEIIVRFGLVGVMLMAMLLTVLISAYRNLWSGIDSGPDLRYFLLLGGVMTLLFCVYEFRLTHVDFRFFSILFFGILYSFNLTQADRKIL